MKFFSQINYLLPLLSINCIKNEVAFTINVKLLKKILFFLKNSEVLRFDILFDIVAIDYLNKKLRFSLTYSLLSILYNKRLNLNVYITEFDFVESISFIFLNSVWLEREVWDMFGIFFKSNFDIRRLLTDYGFYGFPLRKNFPLSGFYEIKFDFFKKILFLDRVNLSQKFINYNYVNPWV